MKKKFLKKLSIIILTVMLITLQQNVSILANSVPEIYSSISQESKVPQSGENSITINKGKTKQFVIDNVLLGAKISYSSSNNKVAYVNSKGIIKGIQTGNVIITAKIIQNKKTYYVKLKVKICDLQKDWYKKILGSKTGNYYVKYYDGIKIDKRKVKRRDFTYYKLIDLKKDGIKELLLSTDPSNWRDNRVLLLTYYNGKVNPLICFEGAGARGHQLLNKKMLIFANSGSDFDSKMYVTVNKGKLKILQRVGWQEIKESAPYYMKYTVDNKEVSKAEYKKAYNKYWSSTASQIEFKRIY